MKARTESGDRVGYGADVLVRRSASRIMAGQQGGQTDVPPPQGLHHFNAFEEPLSRDQPLDPR